MTLNHDLRWDRDHSFTQQLECHWLSQLSYDWYPLLKKKVVWWLYFESTIDLKRTMDLISVTFEKSLSFFRFLFFIFQQKSFCPFLLQQILLLLLAPISYCNKIVGKGHAEKKSTLRQLVKTMLCLSVTLHLCEGMCTYTRARTLLCLVHGLH